MPIDNGKVLSFPIKPETRKATDTNKSKLSNSDKLLIFLMVAIFISLAIAFSLALTNTRDTTTINKTEKVHKPDKEVKAVIDNTKMETVLTPEPEKMKVCIPNSPFPTEEKNIKYTCL